MDLKIVSYMGDEEFNKFIEEDFIEEFVEGNGLYCGLLHPPLQFTSHESLFSPRVLEIKTVHD